MKKQTRIDKVSALPGFTVRLEWSDGTETSADLTDVIGRHQGLAPLRDPAIFSRAEVADWGYSVRWPNDIDLAARTLHRLGLEQSGEYMRTDDFIEWRRVRGLSQEEAASALGLSRRTVLAYESGERPIPKTVRLACRGYDLERAA